MTTRNASNEEAKALLNSIRNGDEQSYTAFHKLYAHSVKSYLRNQLRNEADADEVMVDTMYEVWKSAKYFRGDSAVKTWVIGIAHNKALMKIRSITKRGKVKPDEDLDETPESEFLGSMQSEPDAVEMIAQTQMAKGVQRCMTRLTAIHRECFHLFFFEDMSHSEIATVQRVGTALIKSRLHQARIRIKECLARLCLEMGRPI